MCKYTHPSEYIKQVWSCVITVIKPYPSSEKDQYYSAFSYSANTPLSLTHTVSFSSTSKSLPTHFLNSPHYPQVPPIAQFQLRQERTHAVADLQLSGVDCLKNMHIFIHHLSVRSQRTGNCHTHTAACNTSTFLQGSHFTNNSTKHRRKLGPLTS